VPTEFDLAMRFGAGNKRFDEPNRDWRGDDGADREGADRFAAGRASRSSAIPAHWDMLGPMILAALFLREDGLAYLGNLSENRSLLEGA
jgi:hypothetical protein